MSKVQASAPSRILVIQGHPDASSDHFCYALADAYIKGAHETGHDANLLIVSKLEFSILHSKEEWENDEPSKDIRKAQSDIERADHIVIFYPLWLGSMPALLKAFFEQVLRPGFAIDVKKNGKGWERRLSGKSARIVITMGMPATIYRWYFRAHSLKNLERNILGLCGIKPIKANLIGMVEDENDAKHKKWLEKMHALGRKGA